MIFYNISIQFHPLPPVRKYARKLSNLSLQMDIYSLIYSFFQNTDRYLEFIIGCLVSINLHIIKQEANITMACTD